MKNLTILIPLPYILLANDSLQDEANGRQEGFLRLSFKGTGGFIYYLKLCKSPPNTGNPVSSFLS